MLINVRVIAQVFENKAFADGGTPVWRPKGAQVFNMPIEFGHVIGVEDEHMNDAIQYILDSQCNELYKYELLEFEVEFKTAMELPKEALLDALMVVE